MSVASPLTVEMFEWPICPGCGGRMHRKRTRCTKCRHAEERAVRRGM